MLHSITIARLNAWRSEVATLHSPKRFLCALRTLLSNRELDAPLLVKHRSIVLKGFFGITGSLENHSKRIPVVSLVAGGGSRPLDDRQLVLAIAIFLWYRQDFSGFCQIFLAFPNWSGGS